MNYLTPSIIGNRTPNVPAHNLSSIALPVGFLKPTTSAIIAPQIRFRCWFSKPIANAMKVAYFPSHSAICKPSHNAITPYRKIICLKNNLTKQTAAV